MNLGGNKGLRGCRPALQKLLKKISKVHKKMQGVLNRGGGPNFSERQGCRGYYQARHSYWAQGRAVQKEGKGAKVREKKPDPGALEI